MSNFRITYRWTYIHETLGNGKGKPGAKKGDVWFQSVPRTYRNMQSIERSDIVFVGFNALGWMGNQKIYLYHQIDKNKYRRLEIVGMTLDNHVYKNKSVTSHLHSSYQSNNDEESPFLVPLHLPSMQKLSLKDQNQLATCCRLLLMNCYVKKKIRWYQRGIFKVLLIVAIVVVAIFNPAAIGAMSGVLGANAMVGAAILGAGASAVAAAIAGAVANYIAAIVLSTILQKAAAAAFGEELGALVAAVATFVIGNITSQLSTQFISTGTITGINWGNIFSPSNIIRLTEAVAGGIQGYFSAKINDIRGDYEMALEEYKEGMEKIEDKMLEVFGPDVWIDPLMFTESQFSERHNFRESSETYLNRTLLTGTDIANLSLLAISEFPNITVKLPEAII